MAITVNVNGVPIQYPQTGDPGWGDNATKFAEEVASVLGKIGQSQAPVNDDIIVSPGNLSVTSGNLSVGGDASVTGNTTLTGNITVNGNSNLGNGTSDTTAITGILNVDSGVLYVDPTNNRVGINDATPSEALDVTGNALISGTLGVTGATSLSSTLAVTGNSTLTGNLSVNGNTTLGDASGDSLTINSNGVSIPNGLNFDSNTLVIDATNNRVGIGVASPSTTLDITGGVLFKNSDTYSGMNIRNTADSSALQRISLIDFSNNLGQNDSSIFAYHNTNGSCDLTLFTTPAGSRSSDRRVASLSISGNGQLNAVVPGGSTLYPGYLCRAWVNFDGTGTFSPNPSTTKIRASGNVTSITDNGTGDYTVNFTNAMPDTNYIYTGSCGNDTPRILVGREDLTAKTVSLFRVATYSVNATILDVSNINISVFR